MRNVERILEPVRRELGEAASTAAWVEGSELDLECVVEHALAEPATSD